MTSLSELANGIQVPALDLAAIGESNANKGKDIFAPKERKAWDKSVEARTDFTFRLKISPRAGMNFVSIWEKSAHGRTLTDIKGDDGEIAHFAESLAPVIQQCLGSNLRSSGWCIVVPPCRRHKERNFATLVAEELGKRLDIPFHPAIAECSSRERLKAVFSLNYDFPEPNVIVFDDFVTTGSTMAAMKDLLEQIGKTHFMVAGVNNHARI